MDCNVSSCFSCAIVKSFLNGFKEIFVFPIFSIVSEIYLYTVFKLLVVTALSILHSSIMLWIYNLLIPIKIFEIPASKLVRLLVSL